ncbi:MAG: thioredoxin family protein [Bacteroidales bacterium]|jgi:thioredoxin-like negative regulator of GroEL|nr:thioredoxin family protein [Bacteroidales bacterium]
MRRHNIFFVLFIVLIAVTFTLSCNRSKNNVPIQIDAKKPQIDEYAALFEENKPVQRIAEDLSGKVIILTEKDFIERITDIDSPKGFQYKGQTPCVVEIFAYTCKFCTYQSDLLNVMAPEYQSKVIFYKIDIDRAYDVRTAFKVDNIPTLLFFKPKGKYTSTIGYQNREKLTNLIDELLLKP